MKKTLTTGDIRVLGGELVKNWEEHKKEIKLPGKQLLALIGLKKQIESHLITVEETVMQLAMQFGAIPREDGSVVIPEEKRPEAFEALNDFGRETIEIESPEIVITKEDNLPISIIEPLFDFIQFQE